MDLNWRVGKFVYPRGGTSPLHYMPLKSFHLDDALNLALLMSMRTRRLSGSDKMVGDLDLARWMDRMAIDAIGTLAVALLRVGRADGRWSVVELAPGHGLLFESLKLAAAAEGTALDYTAVGPPAVQRPFDLLHGQDRPAYRFVADPRSAPSEPDLLIFNHNMAVRQPLAETAIEPLIDGPGRQKLLALRVTAGEEDRERTTVTGRRVVLPALDRVLTLLQASDHYWSYRFNERLDDDFFLPEGGPPTGLLLASMACEEFDHPGFAAVHARDGNR
jgi:hypothetical protein